METDATEIYDTWGAPNSRVEPPVVHVVRGMGRWLPFLSRTDAAPLVCLSDWQYEPSTQQRFWEQALPLVEDACGGSEELARALILVAGDMASAGDELRGQSSDSVPDLSPFSACLGPAGTLLFVYGNHDEEVHAPPDGARLLPDGETVDTGRDTGQLDQAIASSEKQARWRKDAKKSGATACGLRVGGVHGIPSGQESKPGTSPWKKRPRDIYFRQLRKVCNDAHIVVLHSNPRLPGQEEIEGVDAPKVFDTFQQSSAKLLVHGHMHTQEVVTIVGDEKVVVNSDCRVVVFPPGVENQSADAAASDDVAEEDAAAASPCNPATVHVAGAWVPGLGPETSMVPTCAPEFALGSDGDHGRPMPPSVGTEGAIAVQPPHHRLPVCAAPGQGEARDVIEGAGGASGCRSAQRNVRWRNKA